MRIKRSQAVLAAAAITAAIPGVAAVGPVVADVAPSPSRTNAAKPQLPSHYTQRALNRVAKAEVVVSGLDNPRQLAWDNKGRLLIAEAGHGSYGRKGTCFESPEAGENCVGRSGKISRIAHPARATNRTPNRIATHFLSAAAPDGTFAVGSNGVSQGPSAAKIFVQEAAFPPRLLRSAGMSDHQNGKLLRLNKKVVANIRAYEFRHNPDGENVESNPYAVLALRNHQLVADAAGDDILHVKRGHRSVWALMPGDTKKVDPVPTSLAKGRNGSVYVGTLYGLAPHKARVLHYSKRGVLMRSWRGFTTVTGVAAGPNGHVFVSELFAGCPQGPSPTCVPGRVTDLAPDGTRTKVPVPWPAGIAWRKGHLYVSAWSIAPATGAFGNPDASGQVLRLR